MIQRIQSLFLLLAILANLGLLFLPFWQFGGADQVETLSALRIESTAAPAPMAFTEDPLHMGVFALVLAISAFLLLVIFAYRNRPRQIRLGFIALILLLIEIVGLVFLSRMGPWSISAVGEGSPQPGLALPILGVILVWLAVRAIKKDEELVRSIDRIR